MNEKEDLPDDQNQNNNDQNQKINVNNNNDENIPDIMKMMAEMRAELQVLKADKAQKRDYDHRGDFLFQPSRLSAPKIRIETSPIRWYTPANCEKNQVSIFDLKTLKGNVPLIRK